MYIFKELLQYSADGHRQLVKYYEDFELSEECIICLQSVQTLKSQFKFYLVFRYLTNKSQRKSKKIFSTVSKFQIP